MRDAYSGAQSDDHARVHTEASPVLPSARKEAQNLAAKPCNPVVSSREKGNSVRPERVFSLTQTEDWRPGVKTRLRVDLIDFSNLRYSEDR